MNSARIKIAYIAVFKKAKEPDKAKRLREETNRIIEALGEDVVLEAPDSYISYFYPRTVQLSEYFDEKNTLVFLDEPMRLKERGDGVHAVLPYHLRSPLPLEKQIRTRSDPLSAGSSVQSSESYLFHLPKARF